MHQTTPIGLSQSHRRGDIQAIHVRKRSQDFLCKSDVIGSGLCMPVRSGSVDTVFMVATLLFMEEWQRPVDECCRVVRTGGRYVILDYKPRIAVRLGYPGRFTPQSLLARLAVNGLQGQLHTEFLPVHHVGPLRVQWVRRAVSRVLNLASSWIVVSAVKTQTAPERWGDE